MIVNHKLYMLNGPFISDFLRVMVLIISNPILMCGCEIYSFKLISYLRVEFLIVISFDYFKYLPMFSSHISNLLDLGF